MKNTSGFRPMDLKVLVLPDPVKEVSQGGIIMPDSVKERDKYATVKGTLVAVGENAWEEAASRSAAFRKPAPGDRVLIAKYGGVMLPSEDGNEYRIMNDEDVIARLEE